MKTNPYCAKFDEYLVKYVGSKINTLLEMPLFMYACKALRTGERYFST
jgi:hypothetical protein